MSTTRAQVKHIASLARLRLSERECDEMAEQLGRILGYIQQLREVDVGGVPPMNHALQITDVVRDDEPDRGLECGSALSNAPELRHGCFVVPRVLPE